MDVEVGLSPYRTNVDWGCNFSFWGSAAFYVKALFVSA
jgi:hypothetical protein